MAETDQQPDKPTDASVPRHSEPTRDDLVRRDMLLSTIPEGEYDRVLHVGCGFGFITNHLRGGTVTGVDTSLETIRCASAHAQPHVVFRQGDVFQLNRMFKDPFDLIVITEALDVEHIGHSTTLIYRIVDPLLCDDGILASVHILGRCCARFPYLSVDILFCPCQKHTDTLEIYVK